MKKIFYSVTLYILFVNISNIFAQNSADTTLFLVKDTILIKEKDTTTIIEDTNFIFTSPHPLIIDENQSILYKNVIGIDLLFSNSGVGIGFFYDRSFNKNYKFISEIYFSGVKNSDELEYLFNYDRYDYIIANKVKRLYILPLSVGVQRYINIGNLTKSFRPYIGIVATPTLIWEMPYNKTADNDWFDDVKLSKPHYRMGAGIQIGADFGAINTTFMSFKMRYIYTPFGGNGLESVKNSPIYNFGRFYISLSLGGLF